MPTKLKKSANVLRSNLRLRLKSSAKAQSKSMKKSKCRCKSISKRSKCRCKSISKRSKLKTKGSMKRKFGNGKDDGFYKIIGGGEEPKNEANRNLKKSDSKIRFSEPKPPLNGFIFKEILDGTAKKMPEFLIETSEVLGFRGLGPDHATIFHMIIIPKRGDIKWYKDLFGNKRLKNIELLENMRKAGMCWVIKNLNYLNRSKIIDINTDIQFGFHRKPSVGYLHMHMLIGDLTSAADNYHDNWISYAEVMGILKYCDNI